MENVKLNFKVQKIQFALFPKNFNLIDKIKIASDLKIKTGILFDGETTILPLPPDAPSEIPRIILQSKDNIFSCKIAISRIDFFQNLTSDQEFEEIKDNYLVKAKQIYSYFIEEQKLIIGRVGFVIDFITNLDESSNKILQSQLLKENIYFAIERKMENISLSFTIKDNISSWEVNKMINISSLRRISDPTDDKKLALRYDINTVLEKINEYNLTVENIEKILKESFDKTTVDELNKLFIVKNDK